MPRTGFNSTQILKMGYAFFKCTQDEILGTCRKQYIVHPRQIIMSAIYNLTYKQVSTPYIGKMFNRDHSTVVHALDCIEYNVNETSTRRYHDFVNYLLAQDKLTFQGQQSAKDLIVAYSNAKREISPNVIETIIKEVA